MASIEFVYGKNNNRTIILSANCFIIALDQEPITRSVQLQYCVCESALSKVELILN